MSIYLCVDEGEPSFVSSNTGWGDFLSWAEGAAPAGGELAHLCEHGWCQHVPALRGELAAALPGAPPDVAGVGATLAGLLADAPGDAVAVVTDGTGPDES